ncbi:MAG: 2-C-methyl-D-erythritol 2,4-cyclodiphosphate synthase, partial [Acidimicrobiaceae bacterium]|jgi:2-C-methyl-D-erythritol 2,4-cyclodiphosphate synthase|nr:2-C-methyl-D-erythritol 2,4-cyclodiphosphate synthase [Acidimicrobiaceae bacterium]
MSMRIGHAFDIHPFSQDPERVLVLGGVIFPGETALHGHSDADVIAHACIDAILSPAGLGDIGQLFPDTDPALAGADSMVLLAEALHQLHDLGGSVVNIDVTVVAERPKLAPRKTEIEQRLTAAIGAPVTVKGKRAEGLGALGRAEGIACWAVALIDVP